jgi:sigma-54 specific flagellar transcriptional regulator A
MEWSEGSAARLERRVIDAPLAFAALRREQWRNLSESGRRFAGLLALSRFPLPWQWLLRQGDSVASARHALEQLQSIGWSEVPPEKPGTVQMTDEECRAFVCEQLALDVTGALHERLASLFEDIQGLTGQLQDEAIAHHHLSGTDTVTAATSVWGAVDRLQSGFAYQGAVQLLERLRAMPDLPEEHRLALDERLVGLLSALGQNERALAVMEGLLLQGPHASTLARERRVVNLLVSMGRYVEAMDRIGAIMAASDTLALVADKAEALFGLGQHDQVLELADHWQKTPAEQHDEHWIRLQNSAGKALLFVGKYDEADARFEANGAAAGTLGLRQEEVRALFNQATIRLQRRGFAEAETMLRQCITLGAELSSLVTRSFLYLNLGVVFHKTHRYGEALSSYLQACALFKRSGSDQQYAVTAMNLASLYATLGDRGRARELTDEALAITTRSEAQYFRARALFVLGTIELMQERPDSATAALQEARDLLRTTGGGPFEQRVVLGLAQAAGMADNRTLQQEYLQGVVPQGGPEESIELAAERNLALGAQWLLTDETSVAMPALESAVAGFESLALHERTVEARLLFGLALCMSGDMDKGTAVLRSASTLIELLVQSVPPQLQTAYMADRVRQRVATALSQAESGVVPRLSRQERVTDDQSPLSPAYQAWRARYHEVVGEDDRLRHIFHVVDRISESDSTVLIQGESGTGKELIAAAIHKHSRRNGAAFIKVNCAAFVETLLLSELFGHERGAFTGAVGRKKGRFELADGGTLFLDEIGDISPNTQVALLRVLQERRFERVGGSETVKVDVRLICATNRNLEEMVRKGSFRLDLYYRLKGVVVELPALRDRRQDIPLLVDHFCRAHAASPSQAKTFSRDAMSTLIRYSWPGNIRELENFIRSIVLFVDGDRIELSHMRQFDDFFADGEFLDHTPAFARTWSPARGRMNAGMTVDEDVAALSRRTSVTAAVAVTVESPSTGPTVPNVPAANEGAAEWIARWGLEHQVPLHDLKTKIETESIRQALVLAAGNITKAASLLNMKRPRLSQIINADPELLSVRESFGASD